MKHGFWIFFKACELDGQASGKLELMIGRFPRPQPHPLFGLIGIRVPILRNIISPKTLLIGRLCQIEAYACGTVVFLRHSSCSRVRLCGNKKTVWTEHRKEFHMSQPNKPLSPRSEFENPPTGFGH